jgi:anaerobic selenocysteine-containing dehydrogenase
VQLGPEEASARGLVDGSRARVHNALGEVEMRVRVTTDVPRGLAVVEGVHWLEAGTRPRNVNALTSQRLTDEGRGSTFYDNKVEVGPA